MSKSPKVSGRDGAPNIPNKIGQLMYIDPLKMKSGEAHSAGACQFYRELLRQAQVTESSGLFSAFLISAMTSKTARKNQKQHLGP